MFAGTDLRFPASARRVALSIQHYRHRALRSKDTSNTLLSSRARRKHAKNTCSGNEAEPAENRLRPCVRTRLRTPAHQPGFGPGPIGATTDRAEMPTSTRSFYNPG